MSERALEPAILAASPRETDDMESQDNEITAFGEINIEPFQKQYINGQSTPIDAVDALDTDDVDNLPYPTAFEEEDNANHHNYHIEEEDETVLKKPLKESNEQQSEGETLTEKNKDENVGDAQEKDQTPVDEKEPPPEVLAQITDPDANSKVDDPKESSAEDVNAASDESGDGAKPANPTNQASEPTNTDNPSQNMLASNEDSREEFGHPDLAAAQFGQQFTLQVTDENYQESLGKQAFPQVYMPVSIQYNPDTEQYQDRNGEQYINQHGQMVMPSNAYFRTYGGQQVLKQQAYNPQTTPRGRQAHHNDYNQENISPQQQQQYNQRLQTIGIPTPAPEVLAQYERQQQTHKAHSAPDMYVHGPPEGSIDMNIPVSCCVQYSSPSMALSQEQSIGRQPARIVNGKKIGVKPVNPKFDRTRKFPEKLYAVACDPNIDFIRWSATGKAIIVNEKEFERRVMSDCPGLVQSDAFDNFRRQLREYQFECRYINMPFQYDYEFLHPDFQYEREDLLHRVKTRRRVMRLSQSGHPDISPPRKLMRRSGSFGRRNSRGGGGGLGVAGCGNPSCHHNLPPPPPQAPWPYGPGGAYASGDPPLGACTSMFPSCAGHLPQWGTPPAHTYNCHTSCGSSSSPEASNHASPAVTTEDSQQWQAQQGQQMWYTASSTPTPQALYAAANWYPHPQAPASSITQPVAVVQNPQVVQDNTAAQDANNQEPCQEQEDRESDQNKDAEEPSTGQEMAQQLLQDPAAVKREKDADPDSPQVVELREPPRMSPITVQLRQVGGSDQRAFAQKLSVANMANMSHLSSITSLGRLVQPLGTIYGQLETGAGDSMGATAIQLQQPDSQPTQAQPSLRQISA